MFSEKQQTTMVWRWKLLFEEEDWEEDNTDDDEEGDEEW
jgi:hypothetical protein